MHLNLRYFNILVPLVLTLSVCRERKIYNSSKTVLSIHDSLKYIVPIDSQTKENIKNSFYCNDVGECKFSLTELNFYESKIYAQITKDTFLNKRVLYKSFDKFFRQYIILTRGYNAILYVKYTLFTNDVKPFKIPNNKLFNQSLMLTGVMDNENIYQYSAQYNLNNSGIMITVYKSEMIDGQMK